MAKYETIAGVPSRSHTLAKILDLLDQLRDQCAVMAHLHRTEDSAKDSLIASGWLAISEMMAMVRVKVVNLAKGSLS